MRSTIVALTLFLAAGCTVPVGFDPTPSPEATDAPSCAQLGDSGVWRCAAADEAPAGLACLVRPDPTDPSLVVFYDCVPSAGLPTKPRPDAGK